MDYILSLHGTTTRYRASSDFDPTGYTVNGVLIESAVPLGDNTDYFETVEIGPKWKPQVGGGGGGQ